MVTLLTENNTNSLCNIALNLSRDFFFADKCFTAWTVRIFNFINCFFVQNVAKSQRLSATGAFELNSIHRCISLQILWLIFLHNITRSNTSLISGNWRRANDRESEDRTREVRVENTITLVLDFRCGGSPYAEGRKQLQWNLHDSLGPQVMVADQRLTERHSAPHPHLSPR